MTWFCFSPAALNMLIKQGLLKGLFAVRAFLRLFNTVIFMEREFGLIKEFGAEFAFYLTVGFFFVLWALRKRISTPGMIFFAFLLLNGVERFLIEKIRVNVAFAGSWTQAEVISLGLMIAGIAGILWVRARNNKLNGTQETH